MVEVNKAQNEGVFISVVKQIFVVIVAVFFAIVFPKIGYILADNFEKIFKYKQFSFGWDMVHHTVQMLLALLVMILPFWKKGLSEWGFNNISKKENKEIILKFTLGFLVFFTLGKTFYLWLSGWPKALDFDPNRFNVWSRILFRLVMPGLSEEILFRGLVIGILMISIKSFIKIGKIEIPTAGIIAAVIFAIAHVGINFMPFQIVYYNVGQLIAAFVFGVFYSIIFVKTKSLLAPIIIHNVIDGVGTTIDYILTLIITAI